MFRTSDPVCGAGRGAVPPPPAEVGTVLLLDRETSRLAELTSALAGNGIVTLASDTTFASARALLAATVPSAVVVDAGLRDGPTSPLDLVAAVRRERPELKIVWLDDAGDRGGIGRLLTAGADAVFLRQSSAAELARAIRRLLQDDAIFAPVSGWVPRGRAGQSSAGQSLTGQSPSPPLVEV